MFQNTLFDYTICAVLLSDGTSAFAVVPAGALQLSGNSDINTTQGLQTITMSNVTSVNTPTSGATIVQYAQGPDGQFYIPGNVALIAVSSHRKTF